MIRHIVFDMGNVLRSFDVDQIMANYTKNSKIAGRIKEELFARLWGELDQGTITYDEVKEKLADKLSKQEYEIAAQLLDTWHLHMPMNPQMEALIPQLKDNGYHLYLLSNASVRFRDYQHTTPLFNYFNGFVVSAFHKTIKPQPRIYEILFNTFHLIPSECVFIDDTPVNVQAGEELGMKGHVFNGDMDKLFAFFDQMDIHYQDE